MNQLTPKHYELLERAQKLLSYKRREVGRSSILRFINIYLSTLTTHNTPTFHKEIINLLQGLNDKRGGGEAPSVPLEEYNKTPPHFLEKNSKTKKRVDGERN